MTSKRSTRNFSQWLRVETGGGTQLAMMSILVMLILIGIILMNTGVLHVTRRITQTGVDAGVLAGASDLAEALTRNNYHGQNCPSTKEQVLEQYWNRVLSPGIQSGRAQAQVRGYASANGTEIWGDIVLRSDQTFRTRSVSGFTIPSFFVQAGTQRDSPLGASGFYGRDRVEVHAVAAAVAYLSNSPTADKKECGTEQEEETCLVNGVTRTCWTTKTLHWYEYDFQWRSELVTNR